jgi:ACT domain-containing protein
LGIDITNDNQILFNNTHQKLVNTDINSNPTTSIIHNIKIHSIYKRVKTKSNQWDGNPLIYALKNQKGYRLSRAEFKKFLYSFHFILNTLLEEKNYDLILVLPSSSNVAKGVAQKVSQSLSNDLSVHDIFEKQSVSEVIEKIDINVVSNKSKLKELKHQLSKLQKIDKNKTFSMKNVPPKVREYFVPLKLKAKFDFSHYENILIVDDLLATGNSIKSARDIILTQNSKVNIEGLCLFSGL